MSVVLFSVPKHSIHLFINRHYSAGTDYFFKYITYLGDGITPFLLAIIILLFFSIRNAIQVALGGTLAGLLAQFFKRILFPDMERPFAAFKNLPEFHIVEGIDIHMSHSFPSGHAATIFAMCLIIAGFTENKILKLLLFLIALVVSFSRVYLSQHFLIDMLAGTFLGVLSAIVVAGSLNRNKVKWMNHSIVQAIKLKARNE